MSGIRFGEVVFGMVAAIVISMLSTWVLLIEILR
jgi:hypothetical protein